MAGDPTLSGEDFVRTTYVDSLSFYDALEGEATSAAPSAPARFLPGDPVGQGGMASILAAREPDLNRQVAYKVMSAKLRRNPAANLRFLREAQVTAQLEHPNIVPVYGIGSEDGGLAYAMKLIVGQTLQPAGDLDQPLEERLDRFVKVCDAVHYAHCKGVVHRDLKPENIMIGPYNQVYVMDWGLAKLVDTPDEQLQLEAFGTEGVDNPDLTQVGAVLGTPSYMAPEQADPSLGPIDARSDVYALGIILQEIVTGQRARGGTTVADTLARASQAQRAPVPASVDPELRAIIDRATAADPARRYESGEALAEDVRRHLRNEPVVAHPDTTLQSAQRWLSRNKEATLRILLTMAALLALLTAGALYKDIRDKQRAEAREARIGAFLTQAGVRAGRIEEQFSLAEAYVEGLSAAASNLILHGQPSDERWYTVADFASKTTAPPDLGPGQAAPHPFSTHHPHVHVTGPVTPPRETLIRKLLPLRHDFRRVLAASRKAADPDLEGATAIEGALRDRKGPVVLAAIGTREGLLLEMPGSHWDTTHYDPRIRPWYHLAENERRQKWGNPYVDTGFNELVMPCAMAIRGHQGEPLGVAIVTLTFDYLIDELLSMPEEPAVLETFLLSPDGRIQVRSGDAGAGNLDPSHLDQAHETPPFHVPAVVQAMADSNAGFLFVEVDGQQRIYVHYPVSAMDWSFVVEADADRLFK